MALYTYRSQQDMAKMLNAPKYNPKSEMMWNTLNGNTDSQPANQTEDNFFVKRGKSIENALGTTGATAVGGINELIVNENRNNTMKDQKTRMNDIAKKYGFNTYQDVWDARDKAEAEGDTKTLDLINNTINPELQAQATANKNEMDKFASNYQDYVKNDYIGKKTNQDRGKFLGSAMNTMSTIADVMMPTAGIAFNAGQGAWEGFADELEQNGLENFDFERAKNNALAGAASGALVGAVNKGISGSLAKNGGNLFKGGNKLTAGLNNLGANTALGRGVSTLATGATRGAISGAVGGATGAGVSSALNGENFGQGVANALQGAVQGAQAGFGTGAVMAGANKAIDSAKNKVFGSQQTPMVEQTTESPAQQVAKAAQEAETKEKPFLAYGDSELANRTKRGMIADSVERLGNSLEGAQANVTRAAAKDLGIESQGKVIENVRKKTGITNLETQAKFAKELTGGEKSLLDEIQRNALTASETGEPFVVDTNPLLREIEGIVGKHADTNTFGSEAKRNEFINNLKKDISNTGADMISISNRMKANAADLRGRGVTDPKPEDAAKARIYSEIASQLDDLSYSAIPQDNINAMFDTAISEMRGRAQQARNNGNIDIANAYEKAANTLDAEPRTVRAYRSFKKDFVDVSKISQLTNRAENGAAAQMGRGIGTGIKRFADTLLQRPVNATLAKVGAGVNMVADKIAGDGTAPVATTPTANTTPTNYNPATQVYNALGRTEGLTNAEQQNTANYLTDAVQQQNNGTLESLVVPNTGANDTGVYNSMTGTPTSTGTVNASNSYFPATGDYWTDIIGSAMSKAIDANDADAFGALYSMYQQALSKNQSTEKDMTNPLNWSTTDRKSLLQAQNGLSQIDSLENSYRNAVGDEGGNVVQGTLRGWANNLSGGNLDPSAENYVKQANSIGAGIIKNLVNLGSTEYDAQRYIDYLPKLTDTKEQAAQKLQVLRTEYQNVIDNLRALYNA